MSEIERELRTLAASIDFPATPDLASSVRQELSTHPRALSSRWAALALIVAVVAVAAAFVVPQARTAILRFLGVGAVRIEFVDRLPEVRRVAPLALGTPIDPDEAPFRLLRSTLLGDPDSIYHSDNTVTLLYGTSRRVRLLVTEITHSGFASGVGKKLAATGTHVKFVRVRGATGPAIWFEGSPHVVRFPGGPPRLAANTLIWQHGQITLRLEGAASLDSAMVIAESLR